MIADRYLTVQRWRPNFDPWKAESGEPAANPQENLHNVSESGVPKRPCDDQNATDIWNLVQWSKGRKSGNKAKGGMGINY